MSDIQISAGMMVRNEEQRLGRALGSLVGLADELVIVDTGSDDGTIGIIEGFRNGGAMPVTFAQVPWSGDFGAMRMEVQSRCVGDWVFVLDGDEYVQDQGNLRALMLDETHDHDAFGVRIVAEMDSGATDEHDAIRAYLRNKCVWKYPIHNQLLGFRKAAPSTGVVRSYYVGTLDAKLRRSIPMLEKFYAENPYDPHGPFFLAKSYRAIGDWPKVKRYAQKCRELIPSEAAYAIYWIWLHEAVCALESFDAAEPVIDEALAYHAKYGELWHRKMTHDLLKWTRYVQNKGAYVFQSDITGKYAQTANLRQAAELLGLPLEFRNEGGEK
jgi:glycosyltransferase involved in cell wall biosynthesis